ncbi:hypothetical protein [Priestia aryabhattai]|uniref:Lipoprotein n=1 Tax=Priestia aryabhattai TaxID=412384 RepID=A0ABD7X2X7_PRIAR|nr:hypothetical protein [Priestia aryabhattai]WEA46819.1 hypothetical protein PWO00_12905 [Priestia aryabhattai]
MKKNILAGASLVLAASILGACSNGEATTNKSEDTKQTAQAELKMQKGVQFVYNGKGVTDKDLENHRKEFLSGTTDKELKKLGGDNYVAENYVLKNELLKYVGSNTDEVLKAYDKYSETANKAYKMNKGQYVIAFVSDKIEEEELTPDKVKKLYETIPKEKRTMSFEVFKSNKYLLFQLAAREGLINPDKLQKDLYKKASIESKSLKMNKDLKGVIPM